MVDFSDKLGTHAAERVRERCDMVDHNRLGWHATATPRVVRVG